MPSVQQKYQPWKEFFPTQEQIASNAELSYDPVSAKRNFDKPWKMWMKEPDMSSPTPGRRIVHSGGAGAGADDAVHSIVTSGNSGSGADDAIHSIVTSGGSGSGAEDAIHSIVTSGGSGSGAEDAAWAMNGGEL